MTRTILLLAAGAALLGVGCVQALPQDTVVQLPTRVATAGDAADQTASLDLTVTAIGEAAYRTQYVSVLDWEVVDGTLTNSDGTIPTLARTAAATVDAQLARQATLRFAPVKAAGGYTLSLQLKRRDRAGVYQTVASGSKTAFSLAPGANTATVSITPTANGQLVVSVPQPAVTFIPPPAIDTLFPATGSVGMLVQLTGTNFGATPAANAMTINGTTATVTAATTSTLTAVVPTGATTGPIALTASGKIGTSATNYTVVPSGTVLGTFGVGAAPMGLAVDASGNIWVANSGGTTVSKLAPDGALLATYAAGLNPNSVLFDLNGVLWASNDQWTGTLTRLAADGSSLGAVSASRNPRRLALDANGNIWASDEGEHAVSRFAPDGTALGFHIFGVGGSVAAGLAADSAGNVWVCDPPRGEVIKFGPTGSSITSASVGGSPEDVAVDASDNVWVALRSSNQVAKVSSSGAVLATYGLGGGTGPKWLTVGPLGNVWVVCGGTNTVVKLSAAGAVLTTVSPGGTPNRLVVDRQRAVWVSQSGTNTVTKLAL